MMHVYVISLFQDYVQQCIKFSARKNIQTVPILTSIFYKPRWVSVRQGWGRWTSTLFRRRFNDPGCLNPLNTQSDQHLFSPFSNATESSIKIMRIKEMINTLRGFECLTNSPCQYQRKCIENSVENMGTDVRVSKLILKQFKTGISHTSLMQSCLYFFNLN